MSGRFVSCPQCHGNNMHVAEWYDDCGETCYYCVCDDCGYEDPDRFDERHLAVDHWNRRVANNYINEDPTDGEYDKLEEEDWFGSSATDEADDEDAIGEISWVPKKSHIVDISRA